jgi:hypothetical protein
MHSIDLLKNWLVEVDTYPNLWECMVEYAKGQGGLTMMEICRGMDHRYWKVAEEQDAIGWRRFMEGMICRGLQGLQEIYTTVNGSNVTGEQWATGVIIKLLEITHGVVGRLDMYRTKVLMYRTMVLMASLTKVRC